MPEYRSDVMIRVEITAGSVLNNLRAEDFYQLRIFKDQLRFTILKSNPE